MSYSAEISRSNPSCFIFLVDQSASMVDPIGRSEVPRKKSEVVADAINRLLTELAIKCAKEEGVRDYFHVAVIGYGQNVGSAFQGGLAGRELIPLSEVATNPARIEERIKKVSDNAGGLVDTSVTFPIWMEPVSNNGTPMCRALEFADSLVEKWVGQHRNCFPPIVLNLTDGEANDGDPAGPAATIRTRATTDGSTLMFNLHVSGKSFDPVIFPDDSTALPDLYARKLFSMSSPLPSHMLSYAGQLGLKAGDGARGFVYNADITAIVRFLEIGTRVKELR
jgi:hypothetical protein